MTGWGAGSEQARGNPGLRRSPRAAALRPVAARRAGRSTSFGHGTLRHLLGNEMSRIFVNYRRRQGGGWPADAITTRLENHFGAHQIFLDTHDVEAGDRFADKIDEALAAAPVLVVIIVDGWHKEQDPESGHRLIDAPDDWVRREIRTALERKIPIVAVLVDGANLPQRCHLPDDIKDLVDHQASRVRCEAQDDYAPLLERLAHLSGLSPEGPTSKRGQGRARERFDDAPDMPGNYQIPKDTPEPLTTRRPAAESLRATLFARPLRPRVALVHAPPGWGKRMFLAMALEGTGLSVAAVNLYHCVTARDIAAAMLHGCDLDDEERRQIDRQPHRAVALMPRRRVIVFENTRRNELGQFPKDLREIIYQCHADGRLVVIKSWTPITLPAIAQGQVEYLNEGAMAPLADEEVRAWGKRVVGRELTEQERDYLGLYGGNPFPIRSALETLAKHFKEPDDVEAPAALFRLAADWETVAQEFNRVAADEIGAHPSEPSRPEAFLSPEMWAWFGVLPWARVTREGAPEGWWALLRRLSEVGLVELIDGAWQTRPWARVLGLWHIQREPTIVDASIDTLASIAAGVAGADRRAQRSHLMRLMATMPTAVPVLFGLVGVIGEAPLAENFAADTADYQAPVAPEVIASIAPLLAAEAATSVHAGAVPFNVRLMLLESAARLSDAGGYRTTWDAVVARGDELASVLSSDWRAVKLVYNALWACPLSDDERVAHYERAFAGVGAQEGPTSAAQGQRAWLARLLVAGGNAALLVGRPDLARTWWEMARGMIATVAPEPDDTFACGFAQDTRYRLAVLEIGLSVSQSTAALAHERALALIPPLEHQIPLQRPRWAVRTVKHIGPILRENGPSGPLRERLEEALRQIDGDLAMLRVARRFLLDFEQTDGESARRVKEVVRYRAAQLDDTTVAGEMCAGIACIVIDPVGEEHRMPALARRALETLGRSPGPEAIYLLRLCLRWQARVRAVGRELFAVCEAMLETLRSGLVGIDSVDIDALRRIGLSHFARHVLTPDGATDVEGGVDGPTTETYKVSLARWKRASGKVLGAYRTHLAVSGDPWLWDDLLQWQVRAAKARLHLERTYRQPLSSATGHGGPLAALVADCTKTLGQHPARHAAALRVAHYVWDLPAIRIHVNALLDARPGRDDRRSLVQLMIDAISMFALVPEKLRLENQPCEPSDRLLLGRLLRELVATSGNMRSLTLGGWMVEVLNRDRDRDNWAALADRARKTLGRPTEYWKRIVEAVESGGGPGFRDRSEVDDLTDPELLTLAARLFQYGSGMDVLPVELRRELAELAVVASYDADRWMRSMRGRRDFFAPWHVGCAIALALSYSPDETLFGTPFAHEVDRAGRPLAWREVMRRELQAARDLSVGRFHELVSQTQARFAHRPQEQRGGASKRPRRLRRNQLLGR